jgi:hypothetical protein
MSSVDIVGVLRYISEVLIFQRLVRVGSKKTLEHIASGFDVRSLNQG